MMNSDLPVIGEELLNKFEIGDLVSWRKLIEDKTGIILKIFTKESGSFPVQKSTLWEKMRGRIYCLQI